MEFNFSIEYKEGKENVVVDSLSRLEDTQSLETTCQALNVHNLQSYMLPRIIQSWKQDIDM